MLRRRVLEANGKLTRQKQGRKTDLPPEVEENLSQSLRKMSDLGKSIIFNLEYVTIVFSSVEL